MIIDFHTHIFPDKIADRAIEGLKKSSGYENAVGGRASELIAEMESVGIDYCVNLPILTNPSHFSGTLDKLEAQNAEIKKIISFGAIHPLTENLKQSVREIKNRGFSGIKIHPFFQNTKVCAIECERLIGYASEQDLITVIHTGTDASFPDEVMASPAQLLKMYNDVKPEKLVLAHLGALGYVDEVISDMCGMNAYFDLSFTLHDLPFEKIEQVILKHGADKILFGSDSPWASPKKYVEIFNSYPLDDSVKSKILGDNAVKLLKLRV